MPDNTLNHPKDPEIAWFLSRVSKLGIKVDIGKATATRLEDLSNNWIGDRTNDVNMVLRRRFFHPTMYHGLNRGGRSRIFPRSDGK